MPQDLDDVRVLDPAESFDLAIEASARLRLAGQMSGEELDHDLALLLAIAGQIDHADAAASDQAIDLIFAADQRARGRIERLAGAIRFDHGSLSFRYTPSARATVICLR